MEYEVIRRRRQTWRWLNNSRSLCAVWLGRLAWNILLKGCGEEPFLGFQSHLLPVIFAYSSHKKVTEPGQRSGVNPCFRSCVSSAPNRRRWSLSINGGTAECMQVAGRIERESKV